ncbi:19323_t:CDS:2, partial [Cetraspora pellucida]
MKKFFISKFILQEKFRLGTLIEDKLVKNETMKNESVKIIYMKTKHVESEAFKFLKDKSKENKCVEVELMKNKSVEGGDMEVELVDIKGKVSEAVEGENIEGENMENETKKINQGSITLEGNSEINTPVFKLELEGLNLTKHYINQPIELSVGIRFNFWAIADHYLKNKIFTAGMQSTLCIESINAIIHKAVASSSSMSDVIEALELHIQKKELNKNYGHLMGHFKEALSYSIEDDDQNALNELILDYIAKKEEIQNDKGRHPNKWLKAFNEETNKVSSNKKQQASYDTTNNNSETRCRLRSHYKSGYYAPKYPNKKNA